MEEKIEKVDNSKKKLILILTICVMTLLLVVGISYALWQTTKVQEDTNIIAGGCFDVSLEGNDPINLANAYPIKDDVGKATTPFTFTIKNKCSNETSYNVSLESLNNSTFDGSKIKIMLNEDMKLYNGFNETEKYFETSKDARLLTTGTLGPLKTVTYNLRMWIDESATNEDQNKVFASKVVVNAIPLARKSIAEKVEIGDYVRMTPTATSFTPPSSITGYTGNAQGTLNPSELNLWRIIKKNEDGTVEMVSDKVSSTEVYFSVKEGYINLVGGLNEIAAQYTDGKNVQSTRHIGYSNQTEKIIDTSKLSRNSPPWSKSISKYNQWTGCDTKSYLCGEDENLGAGDIGYETDYQLVNGVYGTMIGNDFSGTAKEYWLASRLFGYLSASYWYYGGRYVNRSGNLDYGDLFYYDSGFCSDSRGYAVRPIVTIKADVQIVSGDGQEEATAYTFE